MKIEDGIHCQPTVRIMLNPVFNSILSVYDVENNYYTTLSGI